MGNEFGHPEWIDFPREGNQWSYAHARRQWQLAEDKALRYRHLAAFDRDLMTLARTYRVPDGEDAFVLHVDEDAKVLAWLRAGLVFVACFHPNRSIPDYRIPAPPGAFRIVLDTDRGEYGGFDRRDPNQHHHTLPDRIERHLLSLYLPARAAMVLEPVIARQP
jgi:1,4-alpha-glucan branching enzyme